MICAVAMVRDDLNIHLTQLTNLIFDLALILDSDQRSKGPGLRLSWPHPNDRRRAVVAKSQTPSATYRDRNGRISDPRIVRVAQGDLETHYQSAGPSLNGELPLISDHVPHM